MVNTELEEQKLPVPQYSIYNKPQKWVIVVVVALCATLSGFASNIYFPAIPTIAEELSTPTELINLTVTCYMIFQGLSPTVWGAVSDAKGRRLAYLLTLTVFLGACIGLALTRNYAQLLVLRCVQSTGSASTIAIGAGVIGDITTREERGGFMGFFTAGLLLPVAIGPVIGGVLADHLGWKSVFWFLTIYGGAVLLLVILILPETLRSLVGNGSLPPTGLAKSPLNSFQRRYRGDLKQDPTTKAAAKSIDLLAPLKVFTNLKACTAIIFVSLHYMTWQMVLTALSTLFKTTYHLSESKVGLIFLANGVGSIAGTLLTGKILDHDYRRLKRRHQNDESKLSIESARLRTVPVWSLLEVASVLVFGWTVFASSHISAPIIGLFVLGWAAISIQSVVSTLLVDLYPESSASATAALNLARCLVGAAGTALIQPLLERVNVGFAFTIFGALMGLSLVVMMSVISKRIRRLFSGSADGVS